MRLFVLLTLALSLTACSDNDDSNQCACTVSVDDMSLSLACGAQGCIGGFSYGCEEDQVVPISACDVDLAIPPVKNDAGVGICLAVRADCTAAALPCCTTDAGTTPSCDPESLMCCVVTGGTCTTASDCCDGHTCITLGGKNVCGS